MNKKDQLGDKDMANKETDRMVSGTLLPGEQQDEYSLRPKRLAEFIGQQKVKDNLSISIQAARARGEVLDHVLLYGPPGLGKTTLASILANELGVAFQGTSGPVIEDKKDLAAILSNVEKFQILFIDEIHRLNAQLEELLYPALEDFHIDYVVGQGPSARTIKLNVAPVYPDRRHNASRAAQRAAAKPLRNRAPHRFLYRRRVGDYCAPLG